MWSWDKAVRWEQGREGKLFSSRQEGGEDGVWCKLADGSLHRGGVKVGEGGLEVEGSTRGRSVGPPESRWDTDVRKRD